MYLQFELSKYTTLMLYIIRSINICKLFSFLDLYIVEEDSIAKYNLIQSIRNPYLHSSYISFDDSFDDSFDFEVVFEIRV